MRRGRGKLARTCSGGGGGGGGGGGDVSTTSYRGMVATTGAVRFGGGSYCEYSITLEQLDFSVNVLDSGLISTATIQNDNVEATVGSCHHTRAATPTRWAATAAPAVGP